MRLSNFLILIFTITTTLLSCGSEESCLAGDWEGVYRLSNSNTDQDCEDMLFDELEFSVLSDSVIVLQGIELEIDKLDCSVSWVEEDEFEFLVVLIDGDMVNMRFTQRGQSCEVLYERK